jgi:hypothetical protein
MFCCSKSNTKKPKRNTSNQDVKDPKGILKLMNVYQEDGIQFVALKPKEKGKMDG